MRIVMGARLEIGDERGTTLVELLVGLMMGMVILSALTMVVIVTLRGSARVSARVEATQNARIVLGKVTEELHSACVYPKIAPVYGGESTSSEKVSTGTRLVFVHAASSQGSAAAPTPVQSSISLVNGSLVQADFPKTGGSPPGWTFSETASSTTTLMEDVAPIPGRSAIFTYYQYLNGGLSELTASPLSSTNAAKTIEVRIALNASPRTTPVDDNGADSSIQDSAVLRLTPPSFNESATALPCQ